MHRRPLFSVPRHGAVAVAVADRSWLSRCINGRLGRIPGGNSRWRQSSDRIDKRQTEGDGTQRNAMQRYAML